MTPIHNISSTADVKAVYEPMDELTQHEIEKLIRYARAVKGGRAKRLIVELATGKSSDLYIEASQRISIAA